MSYLTLSKRKIVDTQVELNLPLGQIGVRFSNTVPCEICQIYETSPIYDSLCQFLGRVAYHLSIPDKLDIMGAIDSELLETILATYTNIPDRKLTFIARRENSNEGVVTTTTLPKGPIDATFRTKKSCFASRNRAYVAQAGEHMNFEFPTGHYVHKVIIPDHLLVEGGIRKTERLRQILEAFEDCPSRKLVFQKKIPKGGIRTEVVIPKGYLGVKFNVAYDDVSRLPVVSSVIDDSCATWQLHVTHVVEKLIIPNEITVERVGCTSFQKYLNNFSDVEGRVVVLKEFHKDIPNIGPKLTVHLPTGDLGLVFESAKDSIKIAQVTECSPVKDKVSCCNYVESLIIPGVLELIGKEEMMNATCLLETMNEFSHVEDRILILKQSEADVIKYRPAKPLKAEFV